MEHAIVASSKFERWVSVFIVFLRTGGKLKRSDSSSSWGCPGCWSTLFWTLVSKVSEVSGRCFSTGSRRSADDPGLYTYSSTCKFDNDEGTQNLGQSDNAGTLCSLLLYYRSFTWKGDWTGNTVPVLRRTRKNRSRGPINISKWSNSWNYVFEWDPKRTKTLCILESPKNVTPKVLSTERCFWIPGPVFSSSTGRNRFMSRKLFVNFNVVKVHQSKFDVT